MYPRPTITRSRAGFTIIEMMGIALILGLVAGMVMISWEAVVPHTRLSSDVRTLGSTLYGTRSDAIARNAEFQIYYDLDEERYWILSPYREGGGMALAGEERVIVREERLSDGIEFVDITIDGETYSDGQVFVRFTPTGAASDHTIVLHQAQFDRYYTVEVLALTGLIRFHDGIVQREIPREGELD